MSQMMTNAKCIDEMWDQYSSKVLKSCGILSEIVTLDQLRNHEFKGTEDKRDLLAGKLFAMSAEGKSCESKKVCETIRPFDQELLKMHDAQVHVFSDSVLCTGNEAMHEPNIKFTRRWNEHLAYYKDPQ